MAVSRAKLIQDYSNALRGYQRILNNPRDGEDSSQVEWVQAELTKTLAALEAGTLSKEALGDLGASQLDGQEGLSTIEAAALENTLEETKFDAFGSQRYFEEDISKMKDVLRIHFERRVRWQEQRAHIRTEQLVYLELQGLSEEVFGVDLDSEKFLRDIRSRALEYFKLDGETLPIRFVLEEPTEGPFVRVVISDKPKEAIIAKRQTRIRLVHRELKQERTRERLQSELDVFAAENPGLSGDDLYDQYAQTDPFKRYYGSSVVRAAGTSIYAKGESDEWEGVDKRTPNLHLDDEVFVWSRERDFKDCDREVLSSEDAMDKMALSVAHEVGHTLGYIHPERDIRTGLVLASETRPVMAIQAGCTSATGADGVTVNHRTDSRPHAFTRAQLMEMRDILLKPNKIRFIYFDVGKTLVDDVNKNKRIAMADTFGLDLEEVKRAYKFIGRKEVDYGRDTDCSFWKQVALEAGMSVDDILKPDNEKAICDVTSHVNVVEDVRMVLDSLAAQGYEIGILSDDSQDMGLDKADKVDYWTKASVVIISGFHGEKKPGDKIFQIALEAARKAIGDPTLQGDEMLFIDDNPKNISGALWSMGMHGIRYEYYTDNPDQIPQELKDRFSLAGHP